MEPTTDLFKTSYQPDISTASESVFVMGDDGHEQTDSLPTVYHDSTTEIPNSGCGEEQLLILNRASNRSPSPLPQQRYVRTSDMPHADRMNMANRPG